MWIYQITASQQGEAKYAGKEIVIVRTMTCNLKCQQAEGGFDCDTYYTWDKNRMAKGFHITSELGLKMVQEEAQKNGANIIMLTGGEPFIWAGNEEFREFLRLCHLRGYEIHVETNGTLNPLPLKGLVDFIVISPKQSQYFNRYNLETVEKYSEFNHLWKFVVTEVCDIDKIFAWLEKYEISLTDEIWLMPEGNNIEKLTNHYNMVERGKAILNSMNYSDVNISSRLQIVGGFQ